MHTCTEYIQNHTILSYMSTTHTYTHTNANTFTCTHSHIAIYRSHTTHSMHTCSHINTHSLHGGELFDYLSQKDFLNEGEATHYMKQILEGMDYAHAQNIVHLDLKVRVNLYLQ